MSEWQEYRLDDIMEITSSKRIFYSEYVNVGIPFYRSKEIINLFNNQEIQTELFISKQKYEEIESKFGAPVKGDILLTSVGTLGIPYLITNNKQFYFKDGNLTWFRKIQQDKLNGQFMFYWLISPIGKNSLSEITIGSTQPALTIKGLKSLNISLPNISEQQAIASVLSALDDKIDLLQRQNQTLEQMAATLFRQWFIEEAKEDWEEVKLKDICQIINGFAFKSSDYTELGYPVIRTLNFKNHKLDTSNVIFISEKNAEKYHKFNLLRKDFLLVMVGASLGNYAIVTQDALPALQNQNMWNFRAHNSIWQNFLNFKVVDLVNENIASASGSAREFFQKSVFYDLNFQKPPLDKIKLFNLLVDGYFEKIEINNIQLKTIQSLRDTLLPKLISGEVRLKGFENESCA